MLSSPTHHPMYAAISSRSSLCESRNKEGRNGMTFHAITLRDPPQYTIDPLSDLLVLTCPVIKYSENLYQSNLCMIIKAHIFQK